MGCPVIPGVPRERDRLELADIVRAHGHQLKGLSSLEKRVLAAIVSCRTAVLGGHRRRCNTCGHLENEYNSCCNRHCPKCQGLEALLWVEAQRDNLLPLEYFHLVFTKPEVLNEFFRVDPKNTYGLFFSAVSETLQKVAANPEHLGARIGFTALLHTWTQKLLFHPHIHCIVPGGGLSLDGTHFVKAKRGFFLPVLALSSVFKGKFLSKLKKALLAGKLRVPGENPAWLARLKQAAEQDWVVYCKPPFSGPEQVLTYLGRYTHRAAISNSRLESLENGDVTFKYKDRADGNRTKSMVLPALVFLLRFLLHVLPAGLVRIRHCGLFANSVRRKNLARCRELLGVTSAVTEPPPADETWQERLMRLTGVDANRCPKCPSGRLQDIEVLPPISEDSTQSARASPT